MSQNYSVIKRICTLLILFSVIAQADIGYIDLDVSPRLEISVTMNGLMNYIGDVRNITLEMYFPQSSPWQTIETPDIFEKYPIEDDGENMVLTKFFPDPSYRELNYTVHLLMDPTAVEIKSDPFYNMSNQDPLGIGTNFSKYLNSTEKVNISDSIIEKALEILGDSQSELEIVKNVVDWINEHLVYDTEYEDVALSADEVLKIRAGVCDEFTFLFMAILRALKIPTRFVGGRAHSGLEFQYHSWAEVYFPGSGWIPVDPTFNQIGLLDPLHVKFMHTPDYSPIEFKLTAIRYLDGELLAPDISYTEEIIKKYPIYSPVKLEILNTETNLTRGEIVDLEVEVENLRGDYVVPTIRIVAWEDMSLLDRSEKTIILKPYETDTISWRFISPTDLDQGYQIINESGTYTVSILYQSTVTISSYPVRENISFLIDPLKFPESVKDLSIEADGWKEDGKMVVKVSLSNSGNTPINDIDLRVHSDFLGAGTVNLSLGIGESREATFEFVPIEEKLFYNVSIEAEVPINETEIVSYPYKMILYSSSRKNDVELPSIPTNITDLLNSPIENLPWEYILIGSAIILALLGTFLGKFSRRRKMKKLRKLEREL